MKELPVTLKDFNIPRTEVNIEKIKKYDSEEEFMSLAVELLKEVGQISSVLSCTYRLDEKNNPRKWKRNKAILGVKRRIVLRSKSAHSFTHLELRYRFITG